LAALAGAAALALPAAPAAAVVVNSPGGPVSYLPLNGAAPARGPLHASVPTGSPPLEYHGGPVMHSQTSYAIFWAPSGYSFPSGYTTAIEEFLEDVAADSGQPSNVYSVSAQYTDGSGRATYDDAYGGSVVDTHAYPTSGTCPTYSGFGESFTACISDEKLKAEVESVATAQGWPSGLGAEYYVVLPPHAGSCFDAAGNSCFDVEYCAYHGHSSGGRVYANISYSPGDPSGCGVGEYPNGHANGNVDDTLSSLSHEANESITDPLLNAWFDSEGFENGDECRNTPFGEDYGPALGGSSGSLFNEEIGAGHYYLQQEWSNDIDDCAQRVEPATAVITDPGEVAPGESVQFDGSESVPGSGGIAAYEWDFGDGQTGSGEMPQHTFAGAGHFEVTLTVEDDGGFTSSTSRQVTVALPQHELTVALAGSGSGSVSGTGIACPGTCSHIYPAGESVALTAVPAAGSTFSGWSGGGCGGSGACAVTMSADRSVTATFTAASGGGGGGGGDGGGGEGGSTQPTGTVSAPSPAGTSPSSAPPATPPPATAPLKCRAGQKKVRVHGKAVCRKPRKHRHHR
jgi:PKD repeat protein